MIKVLLVSATVLLAGCTHAPRFASPEQRDQIFQATPGSINLSVDRDDVLKRAERLKKVLSKSKLSEAEMAEVESFYGLFREISLLGSDQKVRVVPHSKVRIDFKSFCLDPSRLIPSENERYEWKMNGADIPYYSEVLRFFEKNPDYRQEEIQDLIWNLKNKTYYEAYPPRLRSILDQIDPNAKFKLPSALKDHFTEQVISLGKASLPSQVDEAISLVEGQYYSFESIADALKHSEPLTDNSPELSLLPQNSQNFASSASIGYSKQTITFFNSGDAVAEIDPVKYVLISTRKSVQPIGITIGSGAYRKMSKEIESILKDSIIRNSKYWYGGQLTPAEQKLIEEHPFAALNGFVQAQRAVTMTELHFLRSAGDDESDAYRHFVWAGLMTQQLGESLARQILEAHEQMPKNVSASEIKSSEMDKYNNAKGIQAALQLEKEGTLTASDISQKALQALKNGELQVLTPKGGPVYPGKK